MKPIVVKDSQLLFYISYGIFLTLTILKLTFYFQYISGMIFNAGVAFCVLLLIANELIFGMVNDRGILSIAACVLFIALFIISRTIEYKVIVVTVMFIFCARNIPFASIAKFSAILSMALLIFIIVSSLVGIIPNYEGQREDSSRFFLGFLYALYPAAIMMNITMLVFYIRREKILWRELLLLLICNVWIYLKTDSRMPFMVAIVTMAIAVLMKWRPDFLVHKKNFKRILALTFVFCAIGSILISVCYDPENAIFAKLNDVLSERLVLQHEAVTDFKLTFFGQDMHIEGFGLDEMGNFMAGAERYFYIDNIYVMALMGYGLVFFLLFVAFFTVLSFRSRKYDKQGYLLIVLALLALVSTVQDSLLLIYYNSFLLCIGNVLFGRNREDRLLAAVEPESTI